MAECKHRMVPCPSSACSSKMLLNNVSDHMKEHRSLTGVELRLKVVHKAATRNMNSEVSVPMSPYKNNADCNWVRGEGPSVLPAVPGQEQDLHGLGHGQGGEGGGI